MGLPKAFPNIKPASRSYIPGEYPQAVFTAQNGAVTTLRYGNKKTNARLTLSFSNITDAQVVEILDFYQEINADYDFIQFNNTVLSGVSSITLRSNMSEKFGNGRQLRYRFESAPVVTSVQFNRSNVQCKFVGLLDGQ